MVNLGKEIENEVEQKETRTMHERKFWPLHYLGSVSSKTMTSKNIKCINKEIETWKVANTLWNGKMIKKWPMLKANSVLRAKNKANADQVIW